VWRRAKRVATDNAPDWVERLAHLRIGVRWREHPESSAAAAISSKNTGSWDRRSLGRNCNNVSSKGGENAVKCGG